MRQHILTTWVFALMVATTFASGARGSPFEITESFFRGAVLGEFPAVSKALDANRGICFGVTRAYFRDCSESGWAMYKKHGIKNRLEVIAKEATPKNARRREFTVTLHRQAEAKDPRENFLKHGSKNQWASTWDGYNNVVSRRLYLWFWRWGGDEFAKLVREAMRPENWRDNKKWFLEGRGHWNCFARGEVKHNFVEFGVRVHVYLDEKPKPQ